MDDKKLPKPYHETECGVLYHADCMDVLPYVSAVVCLTDPPYGLTQNKWDVSLDLCCFFNALAIKKGRAICIFSQQPFTTDLINANRKNFKYDIIMEKSQAVGFLDAQRRPLRAHEIICVFCEGTLKYNVIKNFTDTASFKKVSKGSDRSTENYGKYKRVDTGTKDFSRFPRSVLNPSFGEDFCKRAHPTQKPVSIFEWLSKTYTNDGDTALDPFAGSGTTGVAAINTGRRYILIEKEEKYCEIAAKRLEKAAYGRSLFTVEKKDVGEKQEQGMLV